MLVGSINIFAVIPLVLLSNVLWFRNEQYLEILLGLLFMTLLSDSRNNSLFFAQQVKAVQLVIVFILYYLRIGFSCFQAKIQIYLFPYLFIGLICFFQSPIIFESFQKATSYLLILTVVPNLLLTSFNQKGEIVLKNAIFFLGFLLIIGIISRFIPLPFIDPLLSGRFTGVFGNPNGVGVFAFIFIMILNLGLKYYPFLINNREQAILYTLAIVTIITSGSRGALLSTLIFLFFRYYAYKFGFIAFAALVSLIVSFEFAIELLSEIIISLGMGEFLRIETLESGSGRLIAYDFAWENIKKNFYLGLGIGYGDYLFKENYLYLAALGHQGQVHNAYLNVWLDTGLIGLGAFILSWGRVFYEGLKKIKEFWGVTAAVFASTNAEVWIVGSLSPWMITFLILVTLVVYCEPKKEAEDDAILINE